MSRARSLTALQIMPVDARARGRVAEQLASSVGEDQRRLVTSLAREALSRDLTVPSAVRALATVAPDSQELALLLTAQRMAKRELATQMRLVDEYRRQGDALAVVRHLDLALRSSQSSRPGIFPILDAVSEDPNAARTLLQTLARRPNWAPAFALFAVRNGSNLEFGAQVARLLLDPRQAVDRGQYFMLLQRLSDVGNNDLAWTLYTDPTLRLSAPNRPIVRNGDFEGTEDSSRFDWSYTQDPDLIATKERLPDRGVVLRLATTNSKSGELARQILHLSPGSHQISAVFGDLAAQSSSRPEIRLECVPGGAGSVSLMQARPEGATAPSVPLSRSFTVPPNCRFQLISIHLAHDEPADGAGAWVDDIVIR